ncbi:agrin-like [Mya arenaria]|uniref:agrin-like n=1 Tax=Mya arenaria TaxID=6604 RepID=UPI0022DE98DF|nr:agrin-like [Mya arenaria]
MIAYLIYSVFAVWGAMSQTTGTYYTCSFINSFASCDLFITDAYCGTNLVTYANKCEFSKAHCANQTIDLLHIGACTDADKNENTGAEGGTVIFDFFCTSLSHMNCPTDVSKVCGSDNRTYINSCEYEKSKCTHRSLHVVSYGDC